MEIFTICAAVASVVGLVSLAKSGQWRNTAAAAFATAAVLLASVNMYLNYEIAHVEVVGPGVPEHCLVGSATAGLVMLSCPVPVSLPAHL